MPSLNVMGVPVQGSHIRIATHDLAAAFLCRWQRKRRRSFLFEVSVA
jgi:hypothetical protein